jgi:DNA-binding NarL/FixJ family response regulator
MLEKIIIADDHPIFRDGLFRLVGTALPEAKLFEAGSMQEVMDLADEHGAPDTFMLDLLFPGMDPRVTLPALRQKFRTSSIVIVSMLDDETTIERIMTYGADAYIVKSIAASEMIDAIMSVRAGNYVIARPSLSSLTDATPSAADMLDLTPRQREILGLIAQSKPNKVIGRKLGLSPFTVRNHVSLLLRTMKVQSRYELAAKAKEMGYPGDEVTSDGAIARAPHLVTI